MPADGDQTTEPVTAVAPDLPGPALLHQSWRDLTFVHWSVEPEAVAPLMPPGVRPDLYEGRTYVGLVPFRMASTRLPYGPALLWIGTFLETNVRLYSVDQTGRRGLVFVTMDTDRSVVVAAARLGTGLPYRWGRLRHSGRRMATGEEHTYETQRHHLRRRGAASRVQVSVHGAIDVTPLDRFLLARWGLHVAHLGCTWYLPVKHQPWTARRAQLLELDASVLADVGLRDAAGRAPDQVVFSEGVDVAFGRPVLASTPRARLSRSVRRRA